ncbi:hypothetical protein D3C78_1456100 [compost metagenome]
MAGLDVAPQVRTEATTLTLNGAAVRSGRGGHSEYLVALYLERPTPDAERILASEQPTRIQMTFLDRFSALRIARELLDELSMNVEPQALARIKPQVDQLTGLAPRQFMRGDQIELDYLPGQGTQVAINGAVLGILPGRELYTALLSLWLGPRPVSRDFKAALLERGSVP